jgi:hypothetical protein
MSSQQRFLTNEEIAELRTYLNGGVHEAWDRCLPVWLNSSWKDARWAHGGRVDDLPTGLRKSRHSPSRENILGRLFVEQYAEDYGFLLGRLTSEIRGERLCAFDLLVQLARGLRENFLPLPKELRDCELPLPEEVRPDILADRIYDELARPTVGAFLEFEHNGQCPPES